MRLRPSTRESGGFVSVQTAWEQLASYFLALTDALERLVNALPRYAQYDIPDFADYRSEMRDITAMSMSCTRRWSDSLTTRTATQSTASRQASDPTIAVDGFRRCMWDR